ncbi:MAG: DegT/DnrJ/EryC1/StrS family aminotransferase [Lachnospiraceae bacterium]|jgi:dTDP-4-amino-4,6-dideoxygalactose transaminase|nr:DegT/DnrJ/EryC1/StrS family aminotransferase [Lachnospiraceae bacterium]
MGRMIKPTQPVMPDKEKYIQEISSIWDTGAMTNNGEKVRRFKEMLVSYMQWDNLDLFVNGHSALMIAIQALNLTGEVITSPFTFASTTNAIVQNGLVPVFGDIDDSYNLSPVSIEEFITERTTAIITPHIFGIPCDVEKIEKLAEKYHLKVIYDGAQAFGTKISGKSIGCFGDITMFSFHAIKVFNSIEGGMLAYRDKDLQKSFELYRNFGISYGELSSDVEVFGMNAKMNEFQAAMGIVNLPGLDEEIQKRKKLAQEYCELLKDIPGIITYPYQSQIDYNYAYFPVQITENYGMSRDELWLKLKSKGIGTRKLYDKLIYDYHCYQDKKYLRNSVQAEKIKQRVLDLPLYGKLTEDEVLYLCETIRKLGAFNG